MTTEQINQVADEGIAAINKKRDEVIAQITAKSKIDIKAKLTESVTVAGINWLGYLTPSEHCDEQHKFNEKYGVYHFDQKKSAPLHAFAQSLRLPTADQQQQLYDRTAQRFEEVDGLKFCVFTDKETSAELWTPLAGWYDFEDEEFYAVGTYGCLWSSSVCDNRSGFYLGIHESAGVIPRGASYRADAFPVRCMGGKTKSAEGKLREKSWEVNEYLA